MPLESANTISQLDEQWPTGNDPVDRGDDHIRLIKNVLKKTFPGPDGNGFSKSITVDPELLNNLATKLSSLETKITNMFPVGSVVIRLDAIDPKTIYGGTWTNITMDANLSAGTPAQAGTSSGENEPTVPLLKHDHTITMEEAGSHTHNYILTRAYDSDGVRAPYIGGGQNRYNTRTGGQIESAGSHTHVASASQTGVDAPTLNVRGNRLFVAIWKRTA